MTYEPRGASMRGPRTRPCWRWRTKERRVLITEDKDFGELVYLRRLPHPGIVRLVDLRVAEQVDAMRGLLERHGAGLGPGTIVVVTRKRVRIRTTRFGEANDG